MIVYEGRITEEPDLRSWVLRTLRDNGPMDLVQIAGTLMFYKPEYVARAVNQLYDQNVIALTNREPWIWEIIRKEE